jgi:hypothetical protein
MNDHDMGRYDFANTVLNSILDEMIMDLSIEMHWHAKIPFPQIHPSSSSSSKSSAENKGKYNTKKSWDNDDEASSEKADKKGKLKLASAQVSEVDLPNDHGSYSLCEQIQYGSMPSMFRIGMGWKICTSFGEMSET